MDPRDVSNIFALILFAAAATTTAALIRAPWRRRLASVALPAIALAAIGATLGSLYFSEIADYVPCKLCWYQRIAMYPLALVMSIACVKRDRGALRYSLALGGAGLITSIYHIQLQLFPEQDSGLCQFDNPCTAKWVEAFGWMTIPQMAGATFALIITLSVVGIWCAPERDGESTSTPTAADDAAYGLLDS